MMERNEAKVSMAETLKIFGASNFDSKMGGGVTEFVHKSIGKCMGSLTKPPVASRSDDFERPIAKIYLHLRFLTALGTLKSFSKETHICFKLDLCHNR